MLVKWSGIVLSILAVAGVVGLVLGGTLPDSCGTTTADRDEPPDLRDEAALAERLAALDAALARQDLSRAVYEWRDAYGLALRSRGWEAMAAVGDAAVRVDARDGRPRGPAPPASGRRPDGPTFMRCFGPSASARGKASTMSPTGSTRWVTPTWPPARAHSE